MRIIRCDVCDATFSADTEVIEMVIPADFLGNVDGVALHVDICSWGCVNQIIEGVLDAPDMEEINRERREWKEQGRDALPDEEEEKAEPKPFIMVPTTPTIGTDLDEKELARFTEQVTGVKRR